MRILLALFLTLGGAAWAASSSLHRHCTETVHYCMEAEPALASYPAEVLECREPEPLYSYWYWYDCDPIFGCSFTMLA